MIEYILTGMALVLAVFLMRTLDKLKETEAHRIKAWDRAGKFLVRTHNAERELRRFELEQKSLLWKLEDMVRKDNERLNRGTPPNERIIPANIDLESHLVVRPKVFDPMTSPMDGDDQNKL